VLDAAREARGAAEAPDLKGAGPVPALLLEQAAALDGMLDSLRR
jgi:hypothetical protein